MPTVVEGSLSAANRRFAIVVSRFNEFISRKLLDGAVDCLVRHHADEKSITVVWVPGSFEIPLAAKKLAQSDKFDAVICVGAVIRGATPHFDYVAAEVAKGIATTTLDTG